MNARAWSLRGYCMLGSNLNMHTVYVDEWFLVLNFAYIVHTRQF